MSDVDLCWPCLGLALALGLARGLGLGLISSHFVLSSLALVLSLPLALSRGHARSTVAGCLPNCPPHGAQFGRLVWSRLLFLVYSSLL